MLLHSLEVDAPRVRVVELARNFGYQAAISARLDFAEDDAVIVMDADLQGPPEVVYAIREQRKERWPGLAQVRLAFMKNICVIARR